MPLFASVADARSRQSTIRRRNGFTLVEVLVALAVFLLASGALLQATFNSLLGLQSLQRETEQLDDRRFVRNQILQEPDLDTFEEGGEITTLDRGEVRWEAEVEETETLHLFKVHLTMEFEPLEGGYEPVVLEETLYLLRPTWSEPGDATELLEDARERIERNRRSRDW